MPVFERLVYVCTLRSGQGEHTFSTRGELNVAPLHPVKVVALLALGAPPDHAVAVRQLAAEDVAEDLGIAVRVRGEALSCGDAVLVEHAQAAEPLKLGPVVVGEAEGVVRV